jgi:hypothetical protein
MLLITDGLPGPVTVNKFGKPRYLQAQVGLRSFWPLVGERPAAAPADVDLQQRTRHRVEADREHDHVGLVLAAVAEPQPVGVISATGLSRKLTRSTSSRLYVLK